MSVPYYAIEIHYSQATMLRQVLCELHGNGNVKLATFKREVTAIGFQVRFDKDDVKIHMITNSDIINRRFPSIKVPTVINGARVRFLVFPLFLL